MNAEARLVDGGGAARDPRVTVHSEADCKIYIDERWAPIYVATWQGTPAESPVRAYFTWCGRRVEEARETERPIAIVCDSSRGERPPVKLRGFIAELSDATPRAEEWVQVYLAIRSPLVRGAIRAMQWLSREPWPMTLVPSLEDGLQRAQQMLIGRGVKLPTDFSPSRYRLIG